MMNPRSCWISTVASAIALLFLVAVPCADGQQQYFMERPQNTSVREGHTAILRCKVGNQQGRAQWTKDGFALGFDRSIAAFPRYAVTGSDQLGEHHMRIENATLDDDAEYQCQVGPKGSQKPIRANALLNVLIPPTSVEIKDYAAGARIQTRENEEMVLQCIVRNAKPAAEIVWFKRNMEIKWATEESQTSESETPRRFDTTSRITVRAQADDNDADYSCEARHPALIAPKRTSVTFNVLYPPGPPEILGYTEGETVRMGQEVNLVCVSRGGNPLAQIVWFKNDVRVDFSFVTSGRESRNTYNFKADASDNNARFRCEASNQLSPAPMKAEIVLTVHFPPSHVTVKVRSGKLRPNGTANVSCESASSNPASRLVWLRDGVVLAATTNSTTPGPYGGIVSKSTLRLNVDADMNGAVLTCQASNDIAGQSIHEALTLEVLYKPTFKTNGLVVDVVEGEPASINLTASANPDAVTYVWSRDGQPIPAAATAKVGERITYDGAVLDLTVVRRSDEGPFVCNATNSEGRGTTTVHLNVQYAASIVDPQDKVTVDEGGDALLECRATGNPLTTTTVHWRREGFNMETRTEQTSDVGVAYLTVKQVTRDDTGAFECVASNGIGQESVAKTWIIAKYKPVVDKSAQYGKAAGDEGERAKLVCRAHGAPNINFTWAREGVNLRVGDKYEMTTEQVDVVTWESHLWVQDVRSRDYGQYDCVARNEMGFDRAPVQLSGTSRPDAPVSLHVLNVTHEAVQLTWKPGFDGGLPQSYRIRYRQMTNEFFKYIDVSPSNATTLSLAGLALGTEYQFAVMAFNNLGDSNYTLDIVKARTLSPWDEVSAVTDPLLERGDAPKIIIIAVSTAGSILLILNVVLITCYLIRRRKKCMEEAMSSEGGSSKSATIEMYAPSSYNETVNGETLSSISEKSESYSQNGSHSDYAHEDATKTAVSTYLIDQGDGQVAYGTYRVGGGGVGGVSSVGPSPGSVGQGHVVGTLQRPPKTVNFDMGDDNYIDTLRRNAFSPANDPYGKSRNVGNGGGGGGGVHMSTAERAEPYYNVNGSPLSSTGGGGEARYAPYPPMHLHANRYNPLSEPQMHHSNSPYAPMGSLNISPAGYPVNLPVNLPLPLPLSMQAGQGGHFSSFSSDQGPPSLAEATAHFSGPSMATVRSLETEGHLV